MMVSFVLSFFPRDVLDEILNLIESVSEDFPSYSLKIKCDVITSVTLNTFIFEIETFLRNGVLKFNFIHYLEISKYQRKAHITFNDTI